MKIEKLVYLNNDIAWTEHRHSFFSIGKIAPTLHMGEEQTKENKAQTKIRTQEEKQTRNAKQPTSTMQQTSKNKATAAKKTM